MLEVVRPAGKRPLLGHSVERVLLQRCGALPFTLALDDHKLTSVEQGPIWPRRFAGELEFAEVDALVDAPDT